MPDNYEMAKFSTNLKQLIKAKGLTAKQLSDSTGIPRTTISEWINGREPTASDALIKLARFLGVSVEFLITGEHPEKQLIDDIIQQATDEFISIHKGIYRISIEKKVSKKG